MSGDKLSSQLPIVIEREASYGVSALDFSDPETKGYSFEQAKNTPVDVNTNNNYVVVESTTGSHGAHENQRQKGLKDVNATLSHMIGSNSMIFLLSMFFQNAYKYVPTITSGAITSISLTGTTATVTVPDTGNLQADDGVIIADSTASTEDGVYLVVNVTATTYDILNVATDFDTDDITRKISAALNKHSAMMEYHDPNEIDCSKHVLDSSYSLYFPKLWEKTDCTKGLGELYTGVIGKSLVLDFVAASYTIETVGRNNNRTSTNFPTKKSQYHKPVTFDGLMGANNVSVNIYGVEQKNTIALTMNITPTVDESLKSRSANQLVENNTDGFLIDGQYKVKFDDELSADNLSKQILDNQENLDNGLVSTFGIKDPDGASLSFTGKMMFDNPVKTKELNGTTLDIHYTIMVAPEQENFIMEVVNGYNLSLASFFRNVLV